MKSIRKKSKNQSGRRKLAKKDKNNSIWELDFMDGGNKLTRFLKIGNQTHAGEEFNTRERGRRGRRGRTH